MALIEGLHSHTSSGQKTKEVKVSETQAPWNLTLSHTQEVFEVETEGEVVEVVVDLTQEPHKKRLLSEEYEEIRHLRASKCADLTISRPKREGISESVSQNPSPEVKQEVGQQQLLLVLNQHFQVISSRPSAAGDTSSSSCVRLSFSREFEFVLSSRSKGQRALVSTSSSQAPHITKGLSTEE